MAQPAPVQPRDTVAIPKAASPVAAGGPIAELQRTLEERLIDCQAVVLPSGSSGLGGPHPLSRVAGPALLAAAYAAVAIWWF